MLRKSCELKEVFILAEQLIVLGNGFDLACGLKSSYSDFFEWLYKKDKSTKKFIKEKVIERNFWMLLFWELKKKNKNWADVESEIEKVVIFTEKNYEYCQEDYNHIFSNSKSSGIEKYNYQDYKRVYKWVENEYQGAIFRGEKPKDKFSVDVIVIKKSSL